jgi:hypothetical protein
MSATPAAPAAPATANPATALPSGLSVTQLMEQMAAMQSQLNQLLGTEPRSEAPREKKTYYHQVPGSSICVTRKGPRGEQLPEMFYFYGGQLTTDIPEVQDFLEGIVDRAGSPVYSIADVPVDATAAAAAAEVIAAAAATIDKLGPEAGVRK